MCFIRSGSEPVFLRLFAPRNLRAWHGGIELAGRGRYELIELYAQDDEQALLAVVRYNRLIDVFLGIAAYSLQNHLRTTAAGFGQVEIDELYVGIDKQGNHYVVPVQAKGGKDQISTVQTAQDIRACAEKFPRAKCRPVSMQFMSGDVVAMFELAENEGEIRVAEERHYRLVLASEFKPPHPSLEDLGL